MPLTRLFYRLIVRPFYRDSFRTLLVVLAVALGVGVVLAIELAGDAAAGSFRSSMETLVGNAGLEVTAVGGVPDQVVGTLATLPYPLEVHPRIEGYAVVSDSGKTVSLIGLDLIAEHPAGMKVNEPYDSKQARQLFADGNGIWVSGDIGAKQGDSIRLQINDASDEYKVRGILGNTAGSPGLVLMDIAAAQRAFGRTGRVDRVLLTIPSNPPVDTWERRIRAALPAGVELRREGAQTEENRRMLGAFRWNLRILSYLALVVGAFLIFNTISVSVVRRRPEIGIVRALGASRMHVLAAFLGEAMCFGIAGAALGIVLGRVMASEAVRLLGATVQNLYVSSRPAPIELTPGSIALGLSVGVVMSLVSAAAPAREASLVSPVEAMARGEREYAARVNMTRDLWIALALATAGTLASFAPAIAGKPFFGYLAALLLIGASAFAIPALVSGLTLVFSGLLRRWLGVEAMLASRSLLSSLRRTAVLVAGLSTAIAMTTSVAIMVGSFRRTVQVWMDDQLKADLFLQPAGDTRADRLPTLDPTLADTISKMPGVAGVDRFREYDISYQGLPATLGSVDTRGNHDLAQIRFLSGRPRTVVDAELRSGNNAVVSEPFANKHHIRTGDDIALPMGTSQVTFHVLDVFYDYGSDKGVVLVDRSTLLHYLPDPAPSGIAVYAAPGANVNEVRTEVDHATAGRSVLIITNRNLRLEALRIFDRTFSITYALEIVAVFVAIIGIAGALLTVVIDRKRELCLLRLLGANTKQISKLILMEAGLIGVLANVAGLALGAVLSLLLIFVINKQSFGWTIQFHWPVGVVSAALLVVFIATVLSGLYPARIATRLKPIEVVHEE
jgi:putative ABC transport system permease protein